MTVIDPKVLIGRRCFRDAQSLLQAAPIETALPATWECGWYDTSLSPEVGSFAVVNGSGPLAGLVGRVVRVSAQERSVYAYVLGAAAEIEWPIALQRRAFLALGVLSVSALEVTIEVVA